MGALCTLGQAYQNIGDDEKALVMFRRAYKKGNENAAWNLGTVSIHITGDALVLVPACSC